MSQISLDSIKNSGYPVMDQSGSTGMNARFGFRCASCQSVHETAGTYPLAENMAGMMLKGQIAGGLGGILSNFLYRIPVVGRILGGLAGGLLYSAVHAAGSGRNQIEKSREEAFKEVSGNFLSCPSCGNFACSRCIQNGKCQICRQNAT